MGVGGGGWVGGWGPGQLLEDNVCEVVLDGDPHERRRRGRCQGGGHLSPATKEEIGHLGIVPIGYP